MERTESYWAEKPFVKITVSFAAGLMISALYFNSRGWATYVCILAVLIALIEILPLHLKWQFRTCIGILIHLIFFTWGACVYTHSSYLKNKPSGESNAWFIFKVEDYTNSSRTLQRRNIHVFQLDSHRLIDKGKGLLTVFDEHNQNIERNDIILSRVSPAEIRPKINPGEPDFKTIQNRKGIYWTAQWDSIQMKMLKQGEPDGETLRIETINRITKILRRYIQDEGRSSLASALLIGYKEDLNQEWVEAYMHTGVIHVIAISGMHLGILFSLITGFIYSFIKKMQARQFILVVVLPVIWLFAILTGSSASIIRSAWMFTVFILSQALFRKNNNMNTLAFSAFVMLQVSPDNLFAIGFQLSFASVGSLLLYQRKISSALYVENKILKSIWQIIATTLAAQILTIPLVIFHFKSFPILFIISNLIVVPLSSLVLVMLILLLIISPLPSLAEGVGKSIDLLITFMNDYVLALDKIPIVQLPMYTWKASTCLILGIVLILLFKKTKTLKPIFYSYWFWGIVLLWDIYWQELRIKEIQKLYILQKGHTSILIHQHGKYGELILEKNKFINVRAIRKIQESTGKEMGIANWKERFLSPSTQILHLDSLQGNCRLSQPFDLIRHGSNLKIEEIRAWLPSILWIADGSNKVWKIKEWQSRIQQVNLQLYSTPEKGFISIDCQPFPRH